MWGNWDSNPGSADSRVLILNWSRSIKHHAGSWICLHRVLCLPSLHLDVLSTSFAISSYLTLLLWSAAAAAKSLQPCPTLCDPIDGSPAGFPVPGILQVRTLEWVAISFSNAWKWKVKVKSLSCFGLLATPWTAVHQAHPFMGFSRQEYWSGVPLPFLNKVFR